MKEVEDLVQEMNIMKEIGTHPNVVTILGVCTTQGTVLDGYSQGRITDIVIQARKIYLYNSLFMVNRYNVYEY